MARKADEPVRLTRIYTRAGDGGETSLGDGSRVPKLDCRIAAFGTVDELNSLLGLVLAGELPDEMRAVLGRIQNELFDVGADISVPFGIADRLRVSQAQVDALEADCDRFNADLPELRSFVLPGGSEAAARLHVARAVCRRAERDVLEASGQVEAQPARPRLPEPPLRPPLHPRAGRERRRRRASLEAWQLALAFAASFAAGYLGSAVGLVLGTLRLPAILLLSGDAAAGAGTNVAISAASAASGGYRHARAASRGLARRRLDDAAFRGRRGCRGAPDRPAPTRLLLAAIAAILMWNGIDLLVRPVRGRPSDEPRLGSAVVFGFLIGVLGGAVGVILGTLRMPALLRGVGLTAHRAVGTNLLVGFALGLFAFATHALLGEIEWDLLAVGVAGALPGAWLGARVTGRFSEDALRRAIGIALIAIALAFVLEIALGWL